MGDKRPGKKYTVKEAQGRIPTVSERVALQAIDLIIAMEKHPIDSHEIEQRVWALTGQVGYLSRLFHVVWRSEGLKRATAQAAV